MIRRRLFFNLVVLLFFVVLPGCLSIQNYNHSDPYTIHHHTWWNYYQRGRRYLRDNNYLEAQADFETALGLRPGARYPYTQERWRARTYGMHIQEGYFPHRELGICLFNLGQPDKALDLLETSMRMAPSARAKFYLNRIRKQQAVAAAPPPDISIISAPDWTSHRTLSLQGLARGTNPITRLIINGDPQFIELAVPEIQFNRKLTLQEGRNRIHIVAEDISGKQTETDLTVMADWTPPQIQLRRSGSQTVASCTDRFGLQKVQLNNQTIPVTGNEYDLPLTPGGPLKLSVSDRAGNCTEWTLSQKERIHLAEHKKAGPPQLQIDNAGKIITLFTPEYGLDIQAEDDTALRSVQLNGKNLLARPTPLFRNLQRIPLTLGTNHLDIVCEDFDGNRTEQQLTVIYKTPEYIDKIYRLSTLLPPLSGEIPEPAFAQRANRLIGEDMTEEPARFYLLADPDENRLLHNEQALSESNLADPRAVLNKGSKLNADLVFITRVLSDAPGQTIYAQVLDTASGKELFIEDIYLEDPKLLPQQINGLVMKIEQRLPLIRAQVKRSGNRLTIDAGAKSGALENMRFLVIRTDGTLDQGRLVRNGNRPAELVISKVESESATVIMPHGQPEDSVQPGDYVFSR